MLENMEKLLADLGIQVMDNEGNYRLFNEVIEDLASKWEEISK